MKTSFTQRKHVCPAICGEQFTGWLRQTRSAKRLSRFSLMLLMMTLLFLLPLPAISAEEGGGGSGHEGGGGCGDVFGDLIHILRDDKTGQPIFAQRWIEMPAELPGYGWGYCPVAVYTTNELDDQGMEVEVQNEIGFLPYSCDMDPAESALAVEVDYFGRLNGGRTKERNGRMHFDEVISNIKQADQLKLDPTGRLMMGFECVQDCLWTTVDSPMESMALYTRVMKYGHLGTNPEEIDTWAHGDPALPTQYHPALLEADYAKFIAAGLENLLPYGECWNGVDFNSTCASPEPLDNADFNSSSVYLAAAANKTGKITIDLVQYLNRFLKITQTTENSESTALTLPALYRDCWKFTDDPTDPVEGEVPVDPAYADCKIVKAEETKTPNYDLFPNIQEQFMKFSESSYLREDRSDAKADLILESLTIEGNWVLSSQTSLADWVTAVNGDDGDVPNNNIANFVQASSDALRSIEFIHNYAIPENLYCSYKIEEFCNVE